MCLPASLFPHIIPGRFAFSLYLPQVEADGDGGVVVVVEGGVEK